MCDHPFSSRRGVGGGGGGWQRGNPPYDFALFMSCVLFFCLSAQSRTVMMLIPLPMIICPPPPPPAAEWLYSGLAPPDWTVHVRRSSLQASAARLYMYKDHLYMFTYIKQCRYDMGIDKCIGKKFACRILLRQTCSRPATDLPQTVINFTCKLALAADFRQPCRRLMAALPHTLSVLFSYEYSWWRVCGRLVAAFLQTFRRLLIMNIHFMRSWKVCRKAAESMREGCSKAVESMREGCGKTSMREGCGKNKTSSDWFKPAGSFNWTVLYFQYSCKTGIY